MDDYSDDSMACGGDDGFASHPPEETARVAIGITGIDTVLGGGLPPHHTYLIQGASGSGKTTLGLQFCMAGVARGERILYVTTCESKQEIDEVARSHGWSLDGIEVHYLDVGEVLGRESQQSVFHPADVDLPKTIATLLEVIDRVDPQRLVIDSLVEFRLLAAERPWFRRQVLALKDNLAGRQCTALLCDDGAGLEDQAVLSVVHGIIGLEQLAPDYGPDRRRLRVAKMRGQPFASGYHDFKIRTGGIEVYPRLVAAEHRQAREPETISSGVAELDGLFGGGGADRGTATLLLGPSGTGKSIVASQFAAAAAGRGERSAMYLFDERVQTLLDRAKGLGLGLEAEVDRGMVELRQIDPAELSPGEFGHMVCEAAARRGVRLVILDSLAGYVHAMPNEHLLALHLHELLACLNPQGVTVLMVMAQHGVSGAERHTPFDLSYVADSVLLFQSFEHAGELRKAISVYKRRSGAHELTLRELQFGAKGIHIGEPLRQFQGTLTGTPRFTGDAMPDVHHGE